MVAKELKGALAKRSHNTAQVILAEFISKQVHIETCDCTLSARCETLRSFDTYEITGAKSAKSQFALHLISVLSRKNSQDIRDRICDSYVHP